MSTVYKKAAKFIANSSKYEYFPGGCCNALDESNAKLSQINAFSKKFRPTFAEEVDYNGFISGIGFWMGPTGRKENKLARSLALLFMHEMYK